MNKSLGDRIKKGDRVRHWDRTGTVVTGRLQKIDRTIPGDLFMVLWDGERKSKLWSLTAASKIKE